MAAAPLGKLTGLVFEKPDKISSERNMIKEFNQVNFYQRPDSIYTFTKSFNVTRSSVFFRSLGSLITLA